ncbi:MAG TPA: hypothetical protein VFJ89_12435 [Nocardioides sp.]|nr:hypothetical protein [Nocardioides sp.]
MRDEQRSTLVQRWIVVTDAEGREHLEARWVVEGGADQSPVSHAA